MKKIVTLLLALVMICSLMSVAAFAEDPTTYTISVPDTDDHSYDVYQIFTGDLYVDNGKEVLSNIKWGANAKIPTGLDEANDAIGEPVPESILDELAAVASGTDAEKLDVINKYFNAESAKVTTVSNETSYTAAVPGYYLIKDISTFEPEKDEKGNPLETETRYIVQIVNDVTISRKASKIPTDDKVIDEEGGVKSNQVDIGDYVPYKITAHVPEGISNYDYYYFMITDKMSDGLTLTIDDDHLFTVTAEGETDPLVEDEDYSLVLESEPNKADAMGNYSFVVALIDAKNFVDKDITVTFSALVNDNAEVVNDPETNSEHVIYSNNPNHNYGGDTDVPGVPDEKDEHPFGETPDKTVYSFSTSLTIHKVDENGKVLTGAEFSLTGDTVKVRIVVADEFVVPTEEGEVGTYYKLADGKFTTVDPIKEDKMVPAEAGAEKGWVEAETDYTKDDAKTVGGVKYRPYVKETDTNKDVFVFVENNLSDYDADITTLYKKVTKSSVVENGTDKVNVKAMVGADGTVTFEGLGAGKYVLTETVTPDGFNTIAPIEFEVKFTRGENDANGKPTVKFESTNPIITLGANNGLESTIVNESGTVLPETGGIGTTIFYVLGGVLLVAAAVLLITKKNMAE